MGVPKNVIMVPYIIPRALCIRIVLLQFLNDLPGSFAQLVLLFDYFSKSATLLDFFAKTKIL